MQIAGMRKRWRWRDGTEAGPGRDADAVRELAQTLKLPPLVAQLLVSRDLSDPAAAEAFLSPKLTQLHDPSGLPGIPAAAERLAKAVREEQPIVIYGDYDVDGVTASAILWHTLTLAGASVSTYIPHRVDEGYGLNTDAIAQIAADTKGDAPPLIVTVDCGITAVEEAAFARERGIPLIITDHHQFGSDGLPDAEVLVHPSLPPEDGHPAYPCPHLCGAGVAFKLAWHFARCFTNCTDDAAKLPDDYRELMVDLLSLVALGTVADVVPLVDENRPLTAYGLGRIKHTRFAGLNAMIDAARLNDEKIDAYHIGFVLGPRLNACGRMGHASKALRLLTEAGEEEASDLASFLTKENERRRRTERKIFAEAEALVHEHSYHAEDKRAIVLGHSTWHPGVVGIVASRLVEAFSRPVVMLCYDNGTAKGSARSVDGVSIHEAFTACAEHLNQYGGHAMAAGLTLATNKVDAFRDALVAHINTQLAPEDLTGMIKIDAEVSLDECSIDVFERLQQLAPFGRGNRSPRLLVRDVPLYRPAQRMGGQGRHLSLQVKGEKRVVRAVGFGMGELADHLPAGARVDLVFEPKLSTWQGVRRAELHLEDLRLANGAGADPPTAPSATEPATASQHSS